MGLQKREGLQARPSATLTRTAARHAEADGLDTIKPKPLLQPGRVILPWHRPGAMCSHREFGRSCLKMAFQTRERKE